MRIVTIQDNKRFDRKLMLSAAIKLICLTAAVACVLTLSGCNKKNQGSKQTTGTTSIYPTSAVQTTAPADTTVPTEISTTQFIPAEGYPMPGWCAANGGLHVRQTPDTNYEAIGGLKYGEKVTIVGREGDWYKINFKDGTAYVNAGYISLTEVFPDDTTTAPAETTTAAQ
jgi:uncharacterized protein YgiM (DUF1202 family)